MGREHKQEGLAMRRKILVILPVGYIVDSRRNRGEVPEILFRPDIQLLRSGDVSSFSTAKLSSLSMAAPRC